MIGKILKMNRKILFSFLVLPVSAIIAFLFGVIVLAISNATQTNPLNKTQIGYAILYGAGIVYLISLALVWTGKIFKTTSKKEALTVDSTPWPFLSVLIFSILFGPCSSYLIAWQSLRKMGKIDAAKSFLGLGGMVLLVMLVALYILPQDIAKVIGNISAIIFPIWLYYTYQKQYQVDNPKRAKFSWSILGWSVLGIILLLVIFILLGVVWKK